MGPPPPRRRHRRRRRRVLAIGHDITALKAAQRRAVQAERLAAIGQMVTGLAHESRNALQRSQACLEMLGFRLEDRPEALDLVAGIQDAQDDLQRLYEEVRCYAAPIHLDRRALLLRDVLLEAWDQLELTRRHRDARLVEHGPATLCCRRRPEPVDPGLPQRAGQRSGRMPRSCHHRRRVETTRRRRPARSGGDPRQWAGPDAEQRRNLFEPFFTTKTQGTGPRDGHRPPDRRGPRRLDQPGRRRRPGAEIVITLPRSCGC